MSPQPAPSSASSSERASRKRATVRLDFAISLLPLSTWLPNQGRSRFEHVQGRSTTYEVPSRDIDRALRAIMAEAVEKKAPLVEIIPDKGSGALKKHVLRFLDQPENKAIYHRVEKDSKNFGRVFVHFRWH